MSGRKNTENRKLLLELIPKEISSATKKALLIILFTGLIVFFNGLFNHFVLDDDSQIVENIYIHSFKNIPRFFTGSTFFNGGETLIGSYYRPIAGVFFTSIYTLFGNNFIAFHFFQLIIHIVNACLLFFILKLFFEKRASLILSLIFLIHPINSETVLYISNAQEALFFFFGVAGLLLIMTHSQSKKYLTIATISFLLSLFAKETGIVFVFLSLFYLFFFMESKKQFYFFLCVSVPVVFFYLLLRNNAVGTATQSSAGLIGQVSLATRLINTPAIIVFYLGNFIYPFKLATFYQWVYKTPDLWHFWTPLLVSILFVLGIVNFAWIIHKKYSQEDLKIYLFFVCWFFLGIGLHLQIFPLDATVADRWFYFPIAGLLGMLGLLLKIYKVNFRNKNAITLTLIVLTILAMRTFVRSFNWRDNLRLALNDVEISKEAYGLENVIAVEFLKQGRFEEAKVYAERSIVIYPNTQNYNTLGLIDFWLGDYPKAKENYLKALSFGDRYKVYDNLARLGLVYGNSKESVEFIRSALKKFPKDYELWLYLSVLEYEQGDIQQARTDVSIAYGLDKSKETVTIYNNVMRGEKLDLEFTLGPDWKK